MVLSTISPNFPGGFPGVLEILEHIFLLESIHTGPKTVMLIAHQLTVMSNVFNGITLPNSGISVDVIDYFAMQHEVSAIDPIFAKLRFFIGFHHLVRIKGDSAKTCSISSTEPAEEPVSSGQVHSEE
jgi:hypothetical protein